MEPGCQLELAGAPCEDLHQVAAEMQSHLDEARSHLSELATQYAAVAAAV